MFSRMGRVLWGLLPLLAACDDTYFSTAGTAGGGGEGWCGVTQIFDTQCVSCHSPAGGLQGSLDLQTDPYAAVVEVPSALYAGRTLVVSGDAEASLLYNKLTNTQANDEGGQMPLAAALQQAQIDVIKAWIDGGVSDVCDTTAPPPDCNDENETCTPESCDAEESPNMLPGADCLACHSPDVPVEGPNFTAAGTLFTDLQGAEPLAGATVRIIDADGNTIELTTTAAGNFYTNEPIAMPFTAEVEVGGELREMITEPTTGACNSCHNCGGAAGGKLYGP